MDIKQANSKMEEFVKEAASKLQCTCDLDRWPPEKYTGHSWVCAIHKEAVRLWKEALFS